MLLYPISCEDVIKDSWFKEFKAGLNMRKNSQPKESPVCYGRTCCSCAKVVPKATLQIIFLDLIGLRCKTIGIVLRAIHPYFAMGRHWERKFSSDITAVQRLLKSASVGCTSILQLIIMMLSRPITSRVFMAVLATARSRDKTHPEHPVVFSSPQPWHIFCFCASINIGLGLQLSCPYPGCCQDQPQPSGFSE